VVGRLRKATGNKVNYQSIGSGGGIAQIKAGTVDFGSSDKPLAPEELAKAGLVQFPSVIGGVVPVVNLPGIDAGKLRFTGTLLADIFLGKITMWNDAAIAALNPGVTLPADQDHVVHRSDGSGTTFNFTNYLSKVSPEWKTRRSAKAPRSSGRQAWAARATKAWPPTSSRSRAASATSSCRTRCRTRWRYARCRTLPAHSCSRTPKVSRPPPPAPTGQKAQDFNLVITDAPGAEAWPIAATNFILMHKQPKMPRTPRPRSNSSAGCMPTAPQASALHYVPLPATLVQQVEAYWATQLKRLSGPVIVHPRTPMIAIALPVSERRDIADTRA
jgi:phosphate transport system substrate-binding protein